MTLAKGTEKAAATEEKAAKLEICNPSVCVGGAKPSNCICPTTSKK